jgi:hypothetical protein
MVLSVFAPLQLCIYAARHKDNFVDTYFPLGVPMSVFWAPRDSSYFGLPDPNSPFGLKAGVGGPAVTAQHEWFFLLFEQ